MLFYLQDSRLEISIHYCLHSWWCVPVYDGPLTPDYCGSVNDVWIVRWSVYVDWAREWLVVSMVVTVPVLALTHYVIWIVSVIMSPPDSWCPVSPSIHTKQSAWRWMNGTSLALLRCLKTQFLIISLWKSLIVTKCDNQNDSPDELDFPKFQTYGDIFS